MSKNLVIIPTYNECENIADIIACVRNLSMKIDVLVVDDNSKDGTANIVKTLIAEHPEQIHILEREYKEGLGPAYIAGFLWALEKSYDYICEMDADFSHPPEKLIELIETCKKGNDLAIGSRYVKGVNVVNWPMSRVLLSYFASLYIKFITGMRLYDSTAGFVCYHYQVLKTIHLDEIKFVGYAFQIEMKFKAWKHGFRLKEIPIVFTDRAKGSSKMSFNIVLEALFGVIFLTVSSWFKKYLPPASQT